MNQRLTAGVQYIRSLLQPQYPLCISCNRPSKLHLRYPGLCSSCIELVPWITEIHCQVCGRAEYCPDCQRKEFASRYFMLNRSAVRYNETIRNWLAEYKYRGNERYTRLFGMLLREGYYRMQYELTLWYPSNWKPDLITWVPASIDRLHHRGFDQAQRLAAELTAAIRIPSAELLLRSRQTTKQSSQGRRARQENVEGVFQSHSQAADLLAQIARTPDNHYLTSYFKQKRIGMTTSASYSRNRPLRILLIDDIYTTGSTINSCANALHQVGIKSRLPLEIFTLTLARS